MEKALKKEEEEGKQEDKPMNVRVAEALGYTTQWNPGREACSKCRNGAVDGWWGYWPNPGDLSETIPLYDTDWSATGPLIEQHGIDLIRVKVDEWMAYIPGFGGWTDDMAVDVQVAESSIGSTPLEAVCNLILALHEAGKLPK